MKKLLIVLLSVTLLTACGGEKKVDVTSKESFKSSVQEIAKSLNDTEKQAFQKAIVKITLISGLEANGDETKVQEILKNKVNGKTASEVIKIAEEQKNPLEKLSQ